jgi:hypothetical protein
MMFKRFVEYRRSSAAFFNESILTALQLWRFKIILCWKARSTTTKLTIIDTNSLPQFANASNQLNQINTKCCCLWCTQQSQYTSNCIRVKHHYQITMLMMEIDFRPKSQKRLIGQTVFHYNDSKNYRSIYSQRWGLQVGCRALATDAGWADRFAAIVDCSLSAPSTYILPIYTWMVKPIGNSMLYSI